MNKRINNIIMNKKRKGNKRIWIINKNSLLRYKNKKNNSNPTKLIQINNKNNRRRRHKKYLHKEK